jgi:hypothetical protein
MAFNINQMRSNLQFDGAMPSLFRVILNNPVSGVGDAKFSFMCKASSIPESQLGMIEVPYFGRRIKVAGVRQYPDWSTTIINDEDFAVRRALEAWHAAINSSEGNLRSTATYRTRATIEQFGKDGRVVRRYFMENCWPVNISPIELSWENEAQIEEFSVVWAYDYWNVQDALVPAV